MSDQAKGFALVALGVVMLSPDAALIRLIGADVWTLLFWRGVGVFCVLMLLSLLRHGRRLPGRIRAYGPTGLAIAALYAVCQIGFVSGVEHTNPANILVLVAATPIFAALFGRLLLGERLDRATAIAIALGLIGVGVTLSGSLGGFGRWQGDLIGLMVPVSLALAFTLTRRLGASDVWPAYGLAGLITACVAWVPAAPLSPSGTDVWLIALLVLAVAPISFALISLGPRYIPAAEVSLLMLLETLLGPLWVWLLVGLAPPPQAIAGGVILGATLVWHTGRRLRDERRQAALAGDGHCG